MKKRIICDTMIWYNIGSNQYNRKIIDRLNLIATANTADELRMSGNILDKIGHVKLACQSFINDSESIIKYSPAEYMLILAGVTDHGFTGFDNILSKINRVIELPISELAMNSRINRDKIEKELMHYNSDLDKTVEFINSHKEYIRKHIKTSNGGVRKYRATSNDTGIRNLLIQLTELELKSLNKTLSIDWAKFPWGEIEFFLHIWYLHFLEIEVSHQKFKRNDWKDIMNMIYVRPNDLYWTEEKKWKRYIMCSPFKDQLFSYSNSI
ncbi:MAG: hypothetical protein ABJH05_03015 [Fulvivirga sp.]